jgi:putative heme-binding domain-containing protein
MRVLILVSTTVALCAGRVAAQGGATAPSPTVRGKQIFESECARCHGIDGSGGMGPSLRRPTLRAAPDEASLIRVIADGIPERGMPPHDTFDSTELVMVARYVRSLGRVPPAKVPGDPPRGRALFAGKAGCTTCHMVRGEGGVIGPDLSEIGIARGPAYLRDALLHPGANAPTAASVTSGGGEYARFVPVRVVTADGTEITGQRINEDTFTIQLRDAQNRFYSFDKSTLRTLDKHFGRSLMPSFAGVLSASELDDVIAYLVSLRGTP